MRRIAVIALAIAGLGLAAQPASAGDKDCSDFRSWQKAQRFYINHGAPKRDPHRLDGDHDGIACEGLLRRTR